MPIPASNITRPARRWRFGRVEFDEAGFELRVDGTVVEVERKPLEVLGVLLEHAGKVVTKSQLVQLAWPGRVIGDAALAKAIARLREAIEDADHSIVRTHHRYGYRLVAEVAVEDAGAFASAPAKLAATPVAAPPPAPRPDAEHRVLTMLFCDLVDSTRIAESLDPETFRTLLLDYQQRAADIAHRYEGHVAQQFGDGLLFYFGYPDAHDDDAERALRCACELLRFGTRAGSYTHLSLRIGVHTGPVVIGRSGASLEVQATGAHLNLASRIQGLAEPDTILASDATFRLVPGLFVTRDFGPQTLRGLAEPVRVHQILQASGARSRLDAQAQLTPFVGRDQEIALAESCWREAIEGRGQTILFSAEPGLGKSRLLMELRRRLAGSAYTWLEGRSDALNRHSAFHVVAELLHRGFALNDTDDDTQRRLDLEKRLDDLELDRDSTIPLLAPLLNLSPSERYPESSLAPKQKRARTLERLVDWITRLAEGQPLVLIVEDLHWCDDSTLEFIGSLLAHSQNLPLLLVATTRPEFNPNWPARAAVHRSTLEVLDRGAVEHMLRSLSDKALPADLTDKIVERAGGVPLFVEELARSIQETGTTRTTDAVPDSLNSLLRARLDRLGPARELIQTLAVIGMECDHVLLQQVTGLHEGALMSHLERLTDSGLLLARGAPPDARYVFKHALIRDSAYAALLNSSKQALHARTAQMIETHFPQRAAHEPEVLAGHFEKAALIESAVRYFTTAARKAISVVSLHDAARHTDHATRLLSRLPASGTQDELKLALLVLQAYLRTRAGGQAGAGVEETYAETFELAQRMGNAHAAFVALFGVTRAKAGKGDTEKLQVLSEQLVEIANGIQRADLIVDAYGMLAMSYFFRGRLAQAHASFRTASKDEHQKNRTATLSIEGMCLWIEGYADLALRRNDEALALAAESREPYIRAVALNYRAVVHFLRRDLISAQTAAGESAELCRRHGLTAGLAQTTSGWALVEDGKWAEGLLTIEEGVALLESDMHILPFGLLMQAVALHAAGRTNDARSALSRITALAERNDIRYLEAEAIRLEAVCLMEDQDGAWIEGRVRRAIEVARAQGARSLELRAATSLARLMRLQGRGLDALTTLKPVYDGFTEGFDTVDLCEARALLAELA